MKDEKKNSFFSWLGSAIRKKKIVKNTPKDRKVIEKNNDVSKNTIFNEKNKQIETLNNNATIIQQEKINFFSRLKKSLHKTKKFLGDSISHIFSSKSVDKVLFQELEETMLLADIGFSTTDKIINNLIKEVNYKDLCIPEKVYFLLKKNMYNILKQVEKPLQISSHIPFVILVVGVNGTGKTTTVVKLAKKYKSEGKSVILAAGDTFRAAGIEQLQTLGKLNKIPVIAQNFNSDPAAVVFDAIKSAQAKRIDILIIDTAGRLHNKLHLMEELKKIVRVIKKIDSSAPHETMLIVDACNGQNTISQTEIFHKALNLSGITITKLDGTAKGGVIFSLAHQFKIPIRYIGIGEKTQDLGVFNGKEFIDAIFNKK